MHQPYLLPCPWCGYSGVRLVKDKVAQSVKGQCPHCDTYGPSAYTAEDAAQKWNEGWKANTLILRGVPR